MSTRSILAAAHHDLRAPLNTIIGYSELLAGDARTAGHDLLVADLERIHAAGQRLHVLVVELLAEFERVVNELEGVGPADESGPSNVK